MSGFGFGYGGIPYGGALAFGAEAVPIFARPLAANLVASTAFFGDDLDDSLLAKNWTLVALDPEAHPRLVQSAQNVTAVNAGSFELPQLVLVTLPITLLAIDGVLTPGKLYRLIFNGASVDFRALSIAASAQPPDVRIDDGFIWDIANPYLSRDALVFPPQLGTYQVTDAGDLGTDKTGEAGLRKRIMRRVMSAAGSFFHLVGYGVGIQEKKLITVDFLRRLAARIKAQVLQEPEVQEVQCTVGQTRGARDVLTCKISAQTARGSVESVVPIRLP